MGQAWRYRCPVCVEKKRRKPSSVTMFVPPVGGPWCHMHGNRLPVPMALVEGDEEELKTKMAETEEKRKRSIGSKKKSRHRIGLDCGYCKKVIRRGCVHGNPCPACQGMAGTKRPDVIRVVGTCPDCISKKPWEDWFKEEPDEVELEGGLAFHSVASSNLKEVAYREDAQELFVRFRAGTLYRHEGVPVEVYQGLLDAKSKGKFFNRVIKDRYPAERIEG